VKFSSVSNSFFKLCSFDSELLSNTNRRPYLIILRLKYKNKRCDFAIPFRSNISESTPKDQYFSLPPRKATKNGRKHGLHYIKMFPIKKQYLQKFYTDNNPYYDSILNIINSNLKIIIAEAQNYLINYENGIEYEYCTNIDTIHQILFGTDISDEVAATTEKN